MAAIWWIVVGDSHEIVGTSARGCGRIGWIVRAQGPPWDGVHKFRQATETERIVRLLEGKVWYDRLGQMKGADD